MSDDKYSIKDVMENYMKDVKESMKDLHNKVDEMLQTIKSHDKLLLSNAVEAKTNKENSRKNWKIFAFTTPFIVVILGFFGRLYIEHVKREIIELSIQETTKVLENYKPEVILK